ncbi:hypothetical protein AVEN_73181-1 [Araneus ventricosus]|uniref:Uncharacterized protein n=1 Tax=Araneus ventricosus TaxID=182803 RepID=A0A4Y2K965_ARAVE|nr:hypothetical protein AVEN_73181-1 [Araneus ventricosus]
MSRPQSQITHTICPPPQSRKRFPTSQAATSLPSLRFSGFRTKCFVTSRCHPTHVPLLRVTQQFCDRAMAEETKIHWAGEKEKTFHLPAFHLWHNNSPSPRNLKII